MVQVDLVDPREYSAVITDIHRDAWEPPCFNYTDQYVRWQLAYPSEHAPIGVIVRDGSDAGACSALACRNLRLGGRTEPFWMASFAAVRPGWRGRSEAHSCWDCGAKTKETSSWRGPGSAHELIWDAIDATGLPVIIFTETGMPSELFALQCHEAAGYHTSKISELPLYGFSLSYDAPQGYEAEATSQVERFDSASRALQNDFSLWQEHTDEQFKHLLTDCRTPLIVWNRSGEPVATAVVAKTQVRTIDGGVATIPYVHNISIAESNPDVIRTICWFGQQYCGSSHYGLGIMPNAWSLDEGALRRAGVRKLAHCGYSCFVSSKDPDHPALSSRGTNLEIV